MDLNNIEFDHNALRLGQYQSVNSNTSLGNYHNPTPNHFYYYPAEKETSDFWKIWAWVLGISAIFLAVIIYIMPNKKIEKILTLAKKDSWDLNYIESKRKANKAEFKADVGWVIYK